MSEMRLISEYPASFCPPIGKPIAYGSVGVVEQAGGERVAVFKAEGGLTGTSPSGGLLDFPANVKAKMGGRVDLLGGYYLIVGGGKSAAKALLSDLGL